MRPEVLRKISQLVGDGATVVGPKPKQSPSLANYPDADIQVKDMAGKLWGEIDGVNVTENKIGKGRMMFGLALEDVFSRINLNADVIIPEQFNYIHRKDGDSEVYFLTNQSQRNFNGEIGFKISGMQPELWNAVSGEIYDLPEFSERNGYTFLPLKFNETDAWFIVFRKKAAGQTSGKNFDETVTDQAIDGSWMVSFNTKMDAPAKVEFKSLSDWTANENKNIQYYGGTATYSLNFDWVGDGAKKYFIDLGRVEKLASVRINGKSLGTVWCYPYRLEVSNVLKKGKNTLEVDVTNPWWNRIVGDLQDDNTKKHTWMTFPFEWAKVSPLQSAGLFGPVVIETLK